MAIDYEKKYREEEEYIRKQIATLWSLAITCPDVEDDTLSRIETLEAAYKLIPTRYRRM